jgi:hypothetical protein
MQSARGKQPQWLGWCWCHRDGSDCRVGRAYYTTAQNVVVQQSRIAPCAVSLAIRGMKMLFQQHWNADKPRRNAFHVAYYSVIDYLGIQNNTPSTQTTGSPFDAASIHSRSLSPLRAVLSRDECDVARILLPVFNSGTPYRVARFVYYESSESNNNNHSCVLPDRRIDAVGKSPPRS